MRHSETLNGSRFENCSIIRIRLACRPSKKFVVARESYVYHGDEFYEKEYIDPIEKSDRDHFLCTLCGVGLSPLLDFTNTAISDLRSTCARYPAFFTFIQHSKPAACLSSAL
jgi:hypothetical protein